MPSNAMTEAAERDVEEALREPKTQERFWSKVAPPDKKGCRIWLGPRSTPSKGAPSNQRRGRAHRNIPQPCGRFNVGGHTPRAPRVSLFLTTGRWDEQALHACDNPLCVAPDHLRWGSASENMQDMVARGRNKLFSRSG